MVARDGRHCKAMSGKSELVFVVFLIHCLAEAWGMPPSDVYRVLTNSQVLQKYVIPCYDTLHTLGSQYLVDDITNCVKDWGFEIK